MTLSAEPTDAGDRDGAGDRSPNRLAKHEFRDSLSDKDFCVSMAGSADLENRSLGEGRWCS